MPSAYETYLRRYLNDNGTLWTSAQIERWADRAEAELCRVSPLVTYRVSLPITVDIPVYLFPPSGTTYPSLGINQITYRGKVLQPLSQQQARDLFPNNVIEDYTSPYTTVTESSGVPLFWAYTGYDEKTIQLFPTPNETLVATASSHLWDTDIPDRCIVEYRTTRLGSGASDKPIYRLIRAMIKDYVLARAFAIEGKGQQLDVAKYLETRFKARLAVYKTLASNVFVANNHKFSSTASAACGFSRQLNFGNDIGRRIS